MSISKFFKKAAKAEIPNGDIASLNAENRRKETQKERLDDALAKSALRQITPFGTIYW